MHADVTVIGIGNELRRHDRVGPAVADQLAMGNIAGVRVMTAIGEPGPILDAWTGAPVADVVAAPAGNGSRPGRIRSWTPGNQAEPAVVSSHALRQPQTYALGQALGQIPQKLVVSTVEVAEVGRSRSHAHAGGRRSCARDGRSHTR